MRNTFPIKVNNFRATDETGSTISVVVCRMDNCKLSILVRLHKEDGTTFMHRVTEYEGSSTFEYQSDVDKLGIIVEAIKYIRNCSKS